MKRINDKKYFDSIEIAHLMSKIVTSELSVQERKILSSLIQKYNLNNKEDLNKIINQAVSPEVNATNTEMKEKVLMAIREKIQRKERLRRIQFLPYAAAVAVITILITGIYFLQFQNNYSNENIEKFTASEPVLEYPTGKILALENETNVASIINQKDTTSTVALVDTSHYTITVPLGTSHTLALEDGTIITMFPGSKLVFPAHFSSKERLVSIEGEAYFDVHHEPDRPFKLKAREADIVVLGTRFNVRVYPDENVIETALVSGIVNINNTRLLPDQKAIFDCNNKNLNIKTIDASIYTDRANGMFVFDNSSLDEIMNELNKWFDFDYEYSGIDVKDKRFRFKLSRENDFIKIMEMMEFTGEVKFRISNKHVEISQGN